MPSLAALVIGLIALIITPGFLFYFDVTPKVAILLLGTAGLLMVAVQCSRTLFRGPRLLALLLLFNAASLAVSTAFSTNRSLSLYGSTWRSFGAAAQGVVLLLTWLVAWICTGRPDRARTLLRGLSLVGIVSAAYGIAQYPRLGSAAFPGKLSGGRRNLDHRAARPAHWATCQLLRHLDVDHCIPESWLRRKWRAIRDGARASALGGGTLLSRDGALPVPERHCWGCHAGRNCVGCGGVDFACHGA